MFAGLHISKIIKQSIIFIAKQLSTPCIYLCFWRRFHQTASVIRSRSKLGLKPFPLLIHTMLTSLAKISQILAHFHVCILAHFHTPLILLSCYLSGLVIVLIDQHWSWQYLSSFMKKTSFLWNLCSLSLTDWIYKQKCSPKITNKKSSGFNGVFPRPTFTQIHLEPEKRSQAADSSGMTIFSYWGSRSHTRFASKKYKFQAVQPLSKAHGTLIKSADVINALLINWSIFMNILLKILIILEF